MIKNTLFHHPREEGKRGQSLVEFALVLPVLLLIVAGTLEVANILTIQNRAQQAAREGARFGAAGGTDGAVVDVVRQASAGSLDVDPERMSVWVVRPVIDTDTDTWSWEGTGGTWGGEDEFCSGDMCDNPLTPAQVLDDVDDIMDGGEDAIDGTRFVVVSVYYKADTVLNLPFFKIPDEEEGQVPLWAYAILNQEVEQETVAQRASGCSAYSLIIERSWLNDKQEGDLIGPVPLNDEEPPAVRREGYRFLGWRYEHDEPSWVFHQAEPHSYGSMFFPGTSLLPTWGFVEYDQAFADYYDGTQQSQNEADWACDDCDTTMHRGDWVVANESNNDEANQPLWDHEDTQRTLRVIVYDYADDITGDPPNPRYAHYDPWANRWMYRIDGFAILRIKDFTWVGVDTMTFEFVRWDSSCGFDE
jgi:hypothetical protein